MRPFLFAGKNRRAVIQVSNDCRVAEDVFSSFTFDPLSRDRSVTSLWIQPSWTE